MNILYRLGHDIHFKSDNTFDYFASKVPYLLI